MFLKKNSSKISKNNLIDEQDIPQKNKNYFVVGNKSKKSISNIHEISMKIPFC
jgi:hypothetical protein